MVVLDCLYLVFLHFVTFVFSHICILSLLYFVTFVFCRLNCHLLISRAGSFMEDRSFACPHNIGTLQLEREVMNDNLSEGWSVGRLTVPHISMCNPAR